MMLRFGHPSAAQLMEFVEDVSRDRGRVAGHLLACTRCRKTVEQFRVIHEQREALLAPALPVDGLSRVLASRASGTRVVLPNVDPVGLSGARRLAGRLVMAAGLVLAIFGVQLVIDTPRLSAGPTLSEMTISPAKPTAGQEMDIRYRPAPAALAAEDRLVLRARVRTETDGAYEEGIRVVTLGELRNRGSGEFSGKIALPPGVVYAVLAVEKSDGSVVDDRDGRLWEVLVHDANGKPLFSAIDQQIADLTGRDWSAAATAARQLTVDFPGRARSWVQRQLYDEIILGAAAADSVSRSVYAEITRIESGYRSLTRVDAEEMASIYWLAFRARDTARVEYWANRIDREAPLHWRTLPYRLVHHVFWQRQAAIPMLAWLDSAWASAGELPSSPARQIASNAVQAALSVRDYDAVRRWYDHWSAAEPWNAPGFTSAMARQAPLRSDAMQRMRGLLAEEPARLLTQNAREYADARDARRRRVLAALGRALIDNGEIRAGLDTLTLAAQSGWDLALYRDVVRARLAAGDSGGAAEIAARIAVDPRTTRTARDSIDRMRAGVIADSTWTRLLEDSRALMARELLTRAVERSVRGSPEVLDSTGARRPLRELTGDRPAVIVFWSRECYPAIEAMPALVKAAERLREHGLKLVVVAEQESSTALRAFLAQGGIADITVHDPRSTARLAFGSWSTPSTFVVDNRGRIRFRSSGFSDISVAQAVALSR